MSFADLPPTAEFQGCVAIGSRVPSISWSLLLVYEAGQLGFMQTNRRTHSGLEGISTLMLIEGIKYCECLSPGYKADTLTHDIFL
jgi:hypothetical protein